MEKNNYQLNYAKSGVDIKKENKIIENIKKEIKYYRSGIGKAITSIGHYSGIIDFGNILIAMTNDGVGSKILIAKELNKFDTIGIDCIAMSINDLISIGAEPVAFIDYLAIEKYDDCFGTQIGVGLNKGAKEANVSIIGGETATLPDIINGLDLAGSAIGYIKNEK